MVKVAASTLLVSCLLLPATARAQHISITPVIKDIVANEATPAQSAAPDVPIVYSDGYATRLKIHKAASFTMLPLFGAQAVLGKMLYDNPTPTRRNLHTGVATAMAGLFAVNTVTGTWNLIESRKDPNHRKLRIAHSLLMLAADAGFVATAFTAPDDDGRDFNYLDRRSLHRNLAIASISSATVGYLLMLFGHR
jgi:hypothetical protein